jgi:hypothetical protein
VKAGSVRYSKDVAVSDFPKKIARCVTTLRLSAFAHPNAKPQTNPVLNFVCQFETGQLFAHSASVGDAQMLCLRMNVRFASKQTFLEGVFDPKPFGHRFGAA